MSEATHCEQDAARRTLLDANWNIRSAIVMLKTGLNPYEAADMLKRHDNKIRAALSEKDSRISKL